MASQHCPQKKQKSLVTPLVSQVSTSTSNSVPSIALEEIHSSGVPNFVQSTTQSTTTTHPAAAVTNHTTNFSGTPCITVQPVTIGTHTVSPVLSLVQASNGQVYLIQQQQSTTTHHSASTATAVGGNELFHHSPMTILATDNLSSPRCDIITKSLNMNNLYEAITILK